MSFVISEFILKEKYTLDDALKIMLANSLTNEDFNSNKVRNQKEIGMNDREFLISIEIIYRINKDKNKNIIL